YYTEGITGPALIKFAQKMVDASVTLTKAGVADTTKRRIVAGLDKDRTQLLKDLNRPSEMKMIAQLTQAYYNDIPTDQQPVTYFTNANADLGHKYLKGYLEMNPKKVMYPDANFSMRTSFGSVKRYHPRDAVFYDYVCTMKGVMEKYVPGDYEFDLPANYISLY